MKRIDDLRSFAFCGGFGAVSFVIMWGLGAILLLATGMPLVGGLASGLVNAFVLIIGVKFVNRAWAAMIISLVICSLSVPTVIFGPPGIYKIVLGLILGLLFELFMSLTRYSKFSYYLVLPVVFSLSVPIEYFMFVYLDFPAAEKLKSLMVGIAAIYFVNAALGSYLGIKFFDKKMMKMNIVKNRIAMDG
ncbi:hypothetical protein [Maridesulfovibrio sp.]|uniref:hypothetical protein n=1 Tax=Maridesulfovibrio sp. TaxID=2795000 RepID=UPI0029CA2396|nr:hypothetical protein [Maridesulfovibrio sp.]